MITDFVNLCKEKNIAYEKCINMCDCCKFRDYVNFWIEGKVHTFYALDDGTFKVDNDVVESIDEIKEKLNLNETERKARTSKGNRRTKQRVE